MKVERDPGTHDDGELAPASEHGRVSLPLSRRRLLHGAGLIGVGALGATGLSKTGLIPGLAAQTTMVTASPSVPTASPSSSPSPQAVAPPDRTFVTTHLTAPHVASWSTGSSAPGLLFTGPMGHGSNGMIMNNVGEPVWLEPTGAGVMDLRVQSFEGQPVLTYWTGTGVGGHGMGKGVIMDSSYRIIAQVTAGKGMQADLHEFTLTTAGTALLTAYPTVQHDLSAVGGPVAGNMFNCHVQEVNVRTGAVLLDWDALEHIPLTDSFLRPSDDAGSDGSTPDKAYDPYHLNSVEESGDALLISSRHTHALYLVDRMSGTVRWRLGGKQSDFKLGPNAAFAWQHDARRRPNGLISMFDNHYYSGTAGTSRGLVLAVDEKARTAAVHQEFINAGHRGNAMGSLQFLPNGNVLVGWGADPAVTEFTAQGAAIYEATRVGSGSYRAYRSAWSAHPAALPDVAVVPGNGSTMEVYASWNGATEVAKWRFLSGTSPSALREAGTFPKRGFETSAAIAAAAHVSVQALDKNGAVLSTSVTIAA
ncbi:arylsulfotransferase family protein [Arthrobacter sp. efr-133-TYG-104]|uniref:arylsulfotransferase family protein n=2 Tax=Bacteria TaxID=2 RepID=UPI00254F75E0|nr:arylsulfotransferase family protein [Arthrobacter sp. efr-133-TYG-104]